MQDEVLSQRDEKFMLIAIEEAEKAALEDEVPVGAVLTMEDEILAKDHNRTIQNNDPTAHAEILVLQNGAGRLGNYRLVGATLYVTKEPCAMCAGAMVHARIKRLVFGCSDARMGAAGSILNVASLSELNHQVEVTSGIFAEKCSSILSKFFRDKRI